MKKISGEAAWARVVNPQAGGSYSAWQWQSFVSQYNNEVNNFNQCVAGE